VTHHTAATPAGQEQAKQERIKEKYLEPGETVTIMMTDDGGNMSKEQGKEKGDQEEEDKDA
jgi:hypothetical protein